MRHLVAAVRESVAEANWYSALALALAMPDICGHLQSPGLPSSKRYVAWCETYLVPTYTQEMPTGPYVFLGAEDTYALRCAFLHQGSDEIGGQRIQKALDGFRFVTVRDGMVHCNQSGRTLQLQVDIFCEDVCQAVDDWLAATVDDEAIQRGLARLMAIENISGPISL